MGRNRGFQVLVESDGHWRWNVRGKLSWEDGLWRSKSDLLDDGTAEGLQLEVVMGLGCAHGLSS